MERTQYLRVSALELTEYACPEAGDPSWAFGSLGSRAATVRHFVEGRPTPALTEAFERQREAWRAKVAEMAKAVPSQRRRMRHGDSGDVVDLGRYLSDRPDCWERLERGRTLPSVTLAFNVAISAGNQEAAFSETAGVAAACAWALTERGYAVRVIAGGIGQCGGEAWRAVWWVVKDFQDPCDTGRMLVCGLPGVMRDFVHGALAKRVLGYERGIGSGLSCVAPPPEIMSELGIQAMVSRSWDLSAKAVADALRAQEFERAAV